MSKKWLVLVIIAAAAVGAWWYLSERGDGAGGAAGLPAIRVKESSLTQAGKDELARVREMVRALAKADTARRFDDSLMIQSSLRKLGDYESSAEWSLKRVEWLEALSPQQQAARYGKRDPTVLASTAYQQAAQCYCLRGDTRRATALLETFLKKYPSDSMGWSLVNRTYSTLKQNPDAFRAIAEKAQADPRYVKNVP
jgi:tetratricopeptide (TPR) repeat protein